MSYKIVYISHSTNDTDQAKQQALIGKITGWSTAKVDQVLIAAKPTILKVISDKATAAKVVKALSSVGVKSKATAQGSGASTASTSDNSKLIQQVKSLQIEVAELRAQMNSLSEFVDEYVHKKDLDEDLADDIDQLLGLDSAAIDLPAEETVEQFQVDTPPTLLSILLPWIIGGGVVIILGLLAWQYTM